MTQRFPSVETLAQTTKEKLESPGSGIGTKIAESVVSYFAVPNNMKVIDKLRQAGIKLHEEARQVNVENLPLSGKSFVVTGTLSAFPRREAEAKIKALGGNVTSSVTRKTTYLVAGESPGSKLDTARRLGTVILDEASFLEILEGRESA